MLLGAGDTSSGAITAFFLAMVAHPEVQKRAQEELDRVVGRSRLPEYSDKKDLVYIEAVIRETLRWLPVAPSGNFFSLTSHPQELLIEW
jgi:cytochrome P450